MTDFKAGDLVRIAVEPPGFDGTVYTVAGIWEGQGWVQLREYANPVGMIGLKLATDATGPSQVFPDELRNPGLRDKKVARIDHRLPDGGIVRHLDDADGRVFCPACSASSQRQYVQETF